MSQTNPTAVRTRFAPSPSGPLHIGGARTALFCWAYAKAHGGSFILRIEDTDRKRSSAAACQALMHDLRWLGIDWDEGPEFDGMGGGEFGPYFCSKRLDIYRKYIEQLIDEGKAYRAFETPQELEAARNDAKRQKRGYRYDRSALKLDEATIQAYLDEGRPYVVRFRLPNDEPIVVRDEVRGEVTVDPKELDDFVILKADGYPTYHFAVVIDDELMNITHIIRGQEHLNNTAKHVLLQDALDFRRPVFAHLSLIFNPDGSKMSKRDKDKTLRSAVREENIQSSPTPAISDDTWHWWSQSKDHQLDLDAASALADALHVVLPEIDVDDFRRAGYLPEVLINYLALLGWSPGKDVEKFDRAFLIDHFDLDRIIKSHAKFDRDKLLAFNLDAIQAMSPRQFRDRWHAHLTAYHRDFVSHLSDEQFDMLAAANHSRSKTLDDTVKSSQFFIMADDAIEYEQTKAVRKALCNGDPSGYDHLAAIKPLLADLTDWTKHSIERVVDNYSHEHANAKLGTVAQPLRIAVSGGTVSPAIFDTLAILGREAVVNRIARCLACREELFNKSQA